MGEVLKNNESNSASIPNIDNVIEQALANKKLSEKERWEIMAKYQEYLDWKAQIKEETKNKLGNFLKNSHGSAKFEKFRTDMMAKLWETVKVETVKPTEEPKKVEETKKEEVKPTEEPKKIEENKKEEVKDTPKEIISSKYINDSIKKVENILKNWIQSGEEKKLTTLIKELQDNKILKAIPGVKWGELEEWQDLISIWEDIVDRLEKIAKNLETAEENKKDLDEKTAKDEAKKAKDTLDAKSKKEKEEIEKFETDLWKIDMTSMIKNLNSQIDAKNNLQTPDVLEEQVWFQDKKDALKSKLDKVKLSSDNKTLSDLTWTTSVEKDDKWNLILKFNLDPKGLFDKFDSSKTYNVKLSSTNLDSQKSSIVGEVEKAYSEQISDLTK